MIPEHVKVENSTYFIEKRSKTWSYKNKYRSLRALGVTIFEPKKILYEENQPAKELIDTIIHEVYHAVVHENSIEFSNHVAEEYVVKNLTKCTIEKIHRKLNRHTEKAVMGLSKKFMNPKYGHQTNLMLNGMFKVLRENEGLYEWANKNK